jgi:pilus assembly protein Flp/PilA
MNCPWEKNKMKDKLRKLSVKLQVLLDEEGQDLIEYALVVALIAFAATAGMGSVATAINTAFSNIGTKIGTYIT